MRQTRRWPKVLALVAVAGAFIGYRILAQKYEGPGDDILIPEGAKPSWQR
jgi:hypothetical protein